MMNRLETTQISTIISHASLDDLRLIRTMLSNRQDMLGFENKIALQVGQLVKVNHPKLKGTTLEITKINRTKAVLSVINGASYGRPVSYTVPVSLIQY